MIDFHLLFKYKYLLLRGTLTSLQIAFFSGIISITFGSLLAAIKIIGTRPIRFLIELYAILASGTPKLLQLLIALFLLPKLYIFATPFWVVVIALGLGSSGTIAKIIYESLKIEIEQLEAAQTLGISRRKILLNVIFPQAIQTIIPAFLKEFNILFKTSTLASIIGVSELLKTSSIIQNRTYDAFTALCTTCLIYWSVTLVIAFLISLYTKRKKLCSR
ncbi:ABC transporter permease subunit [bacterium]|nr:ABC transporter permease subunit [bacterium]